MVMSCDCRNIKYILVYVGVTSIFGGAIVCSAYTDRGHSLEGDFMVERKVAIAPNFRRLFGVSATEIHRAMRTFCGELPIRDSDTPIKRRLPLSSVDRFYTKTEESIQSNLYWAVEIDAIPLMLIEGEPSGKCHLCEWKKRNRTSFIEKDRYEKLVVDDLKCPSCSRFYAIKPLRTVLIQIDRFDTVYRHKENTNRVVKVPNHRVAILKVFNELPNLR